jgi:hypothetical protein
LREGAEELGGCFVSLFERSSRISSISSLHYVRRTTSSPQRKKEEKTRRLMKVYRGGQWTSSLI